MKWAAHESLQARPIEIPVPTGSVLVGELTEGPGAWGLVVFAHGSGSGAKSPRSRYVAQAFQDEGLATLLVDLLTEAEQEKVSKRFDIGLLTEHLLQVVAWAGRQPSLSAFPTGIYGASTGAAAALRAAATLHGLVQAVVSRGGRTDLTGDTIRDVASPTLLIVGERDDEVLALNQRTIDELHCEKRLTVVPGATHLFEEDGALKVVSSLAALWFRGHLRRRPEAGEKAGSVMVDQPTVEGSISMLRGIKERFEVHHGVHIQDNALVAAATLSHRYISDWFLPDKAIDLVDEACATIRAEIDSMPAELDEITRCITQLEIEEADLKGEIDHGSQECLKALTEELAEMRFQADALRAQWQKEKGAIRRRQEIREQIEHTRRDVERAERQYDLNKAAELRHEKLPQLEKQLQEEVKVMAKDTSQRLLRDEVTEREIAEIVSRWTGIPAMHLVEGAKAKALK